jgi:thioredoxin reductase
LSAASRAAYHGNQYVVFEAEEHASDTIYQYQKRKFVMAEPALIPLRSGMSFAEGRREEILEAWNREIRQQGINIQYGRKVTAITREGNGCFTVECEGEMRCTARSVILAIGLQGNVRKLGVPGESLPGVQYTLSDPDEFKGETIVVVGTGDAGIENALALAEQNKVIVFNRGEEFNSCKDANRNLILAAEKAGRLNISYSSVSSRVEETGSDHRTPRGDPAAQTRGSVRGWFSEPVSDRAARAYRTVRIERAKSFHHRRAGRVSAYQAGDESGV